MKKIEENRDSFSLLAVFFDNYWSGSTLNSVKIHDLTQVFEIIGASTIDLWAGERLNDKLILEIGPGSGTDAVTLNSIGASVVTLDLSLKSALMITEKKKVAAVTSVGRQGIFPVVGAAENMPFRDAAFDGIHSRVVWMHLEKQKAISESLRVMKNGGVMKVVEPVKYNPFLSVYRTIGSVGRFSAPSYLSVADIILFGSLFKPLSLGWKSLISPPFLFLASVFSNKKSYGEVPSVNEDAQLVHDVSDAESGSSGNGFAKGMAKFVLKIDDFIIEKIPSVKWYSWFVVMNLRKVSNGEK